jgi:hypothetical protein
VIPTLSGILSITFPFHFSHSSIIHPFHQKLPIKERCKIDGYEIPIKTKVIINAWAIGRDPAYWHDAESFIPERFADSSIDFKGTCFEYIPFGAGRRMCPGILFGLANVELALAQLLYQFDWELPGKMKPEDLDMIEAFGAVAARKNNLHLIPTSFSHSLPLRGITIMVALNLKFTGKMVQILAPFVDAFYGSFFFKNNCSNVT